MTWKRYDATCGCGVTFQRASPLKRSCDECKEQRHREVARARKPDMTKPTPGKVEVKCEHCGAAFLQWKGRVLSHAFCSAACYRAVQTARTRQKRVCQGCGASFQRKLGANDIGKFCSRECALNHKRANLPVPVPMSRYRASLCVDCGAGMSTRARGPIAKRCDRCAAEYARRSASELDRAMHRAEARVVICRVCNGVFCPLYGNKATALCEPCRPIAVREWNRAQKAMRRAIKRGAAGGERFNPSEIFERDKWTCQLCRRKTPKRLRGTNDARAPELDHIVPLAHGGLHTRANVQCACRQCNGVKAATARGQLWLVG